MPSQLASALLLAALAAAPVSAATHTAYRLRVEYLEKPITVDVPSPRFSWALQHPNRAEAQTAYRIVVKAITGGVDLPISQDK